MILRDYQTEDIERLRDQFRKGHHALLYQAPTGSGKTVLFAEIVRNAVAKGSRVWIVVHRQELLWQCSGALDELGVVHGLIAPGYYPPQSTPVLVCSVQTLRNRVKDNKIGPVDLIVLDEAHHATAGTWRAIIAARPNARLLGVTATPLRLDGKGLGTHTGGVFDSLVIGPSVASLTDQGYLAPYKIFAPPTAIDTAGIRKSMGDFAKSGVAERMDKPTITGDAIKHYRQHCLGKPALVFCATVDHAEHVAQAFRADGWRAASVDGKTGNTDRRQRIADLGNGRLHQLMTCEIVSEGTDIPVVTAAILLRHTMSVGLYLQQVGRVLRPAPGKEKAIIMDHVGNCVRHGFPDDEREWSLDGLKQRVMEPTEPVRTCPSCFAAYRPAPACPECGLIYVPQPREIAEQEGELVEVSKEEKKALQFKAKAQVGRARDREALEELAAERGYKHGWVDYIIKARAAKGIKTPIDRSATIKTWKGEANV